jgi:hypothetical protein
MHKKKKNTKCNKQTKESDNYGPCVFDVSKVKDNIDNELWLGHTNPKDIII